KRHHRFVVFDKVADEHENFLGCHDLLSFTFQKHLGLCMNILAGKPRGRWIVPTATDRLSSEQLFHDRQAAERSRYFLEHASQLVFDDNQYLNHETWIRPAMARLGDVQGLDVLDYGCGHGMAAVVLARRGARVTAFDLSAGYLAEADGRARANRVAIDLVQANGEHLPFADASFDRVWGNAVLHHLNLEVAGNELYRVLRP